jgi:hypothetical protein
MMGQAPAAEVDIIYQQIWAQYHLGDGHLNSVQSPPAIAENVLLAANPKPEPQPLTKLNAFKLIFKVSDIAPIPEYNSTYARDAACE